MSLLLPLAGTKEGTSLNYQYAKALAESFEPLLNEVLAAEKSRATGLQNRILASVAESYVNCGNVLHFEPGLDGNALRTLADKIAEVCGGLAAVFSGDDGNYTYCLAQRGGDLRELNRSMTETLGGRGGGKPQFQQGTVRASREKIEAFLMK